MLLLSRREQELFKHRLFILDIIEDTGTKKLSQYLLLFYHKRLVLVM